nr:hypothetical protein [Tanacetum cinerariifolium]
HCHPEASERSSTGSGKLPEEAIEKMLKTRRIMRSLEKFVGGRLYQ